MLQTTNSIDGDPPLHKSKSFWVFAVDFIVFSKLLISCGRRYSVSSIAFFAGFFGVSYWQIIRLKKFLIRLLMFKGGYFYHTHRLGLATVTSTTVFSLFLVPFVDPIQELNSVAGILETEVSGENIDSHGFVLGNSIRMASGGGMDTSQQMRNEVVEYAVQNGDTIGSISEQFIVSIEALKYANSMGSSDLIHPGDVLTIPPVGGLIHTVDDDETISSIASLYKVSPQAIVDFNHIEEPFVIYKGDEIVIPDAQVPDLTPQPVYLAQNPTGATGVVGLSLETISPPQVGNGGFIMPAAGVLTQYFWWGHTAVDIANSSCGSPIIAADSGTITFAGWWQGGGGNSVFVDHGNGYVTKYAHLSGFAKTSGGVQRGEVIGYMGATGRAYGCHLHFIVESGGQPINPLSVL